MVCIRKKVGQVLKLIFCRGILQEKKIINIYRNIYSTLLNVNIIERNANGSRVN